MDNDLPTMADSDGVSVHSGFPNPALERRGQGNRLALDLNQLLIRHPSSTYLFRITGHRWSDEGIYDGDIAIIDRSRRPRPDQLVIVWQDSNFIIYRQRHVAADETVWGVLTAIIHQYR
jgi:DNA polymerase V